MNLTDETVQKLIESIDNLSTEIINVGHKLQSLRERLGNLAGAINPSAGTAKK